VSSPGGTLITDAEYEDALEAAQVSADSAHHSLLIDQVCGQVRRRGVKVALNHHLLYSVRGYVESERPSLKTTLPTWTVRLTRKTRVHTAGLSMTSSDALAANQIRPK
jgi:hypothetical protein